MTDDELIEKVAQLWVDNGGDSDGLMWCLSKIADKIKGALNDRV